MKKFILKKEEERTALFSLNVPRGIVRSQSSDEHSLRFNDVYGIVEIRELIATKIEQEIGTVATVQRCPNVHILCVYGNTSIINESKEREETHKSIKIGYNEKDSDIIVYESHPKWVIHEM